MNTLRVTKASPICGKRKGRRKRTKNHREGSRNVVSEDSRRISSMSMKSSSPAGSQEQKEAVNKKKDNSISGSDRKNSQSRKRGRVAWILMGKMS
jgi:hypothetical protein